MFKWLIVLIITCNWTIGFSQFAGKWAWKQSEKISYRDLVYFDDCVYAVGDFTDSIVQVGLNTYTNNGNSDIVIAKFDTLGNVVWSHHYGGAGYDYLSNLTIDKSGNIYAVGSFTNQIVIGNNTFFSVQNNDILFLKFNSNGILQFAKSIGEYGNQFGIDITSDFESNTYLLASVDKLSFANNSCEKSASILKFDSIGNPVWHHFITGADFVCCNYTPRGIYACALKYSSFDSSIYIGGSFKDPIMTDSVYNFNGGFNGYVNFPLQGQAYSSIFFGKINRLGQWQFLRAIASAPYKTYTLNDFAIHPSGDFYFSQNYSMSLSGNSYGEWKKMDKFNNLMDYIMQFPHAIDQSMGTAGKIDLIDSILYGSIYHQNMNLGYNCSDYYAVQHNINTKVNQYINIEPAYSFNTLFSPYMSVTGKNGNFFIGNQTYFGKTCSANCPTSLLKIDPAPDLNLCQSGVNMLGKLPCFYASGGTPPYTYSWAPSSGLSDSNISNPLVFGINSDMTYTVTVTDQLNNVVYDTINVYYFNDKIFKNLNIVSCDEFTFNGNTYYSSGVYYDSILTQGSCYIHYTLNLTINQNTRTDIYQSVCPSFVFYGQILTQSGVYYHPLLNTSGCDSTIRLYLTILSSSDTLNITSCDSFLFNSNNLLQSGIYYDTLVNVNGCDSIVVLNLNINNSSNFSINDTVCGNYFFNNQTLTSSGIYYDTLVNVKGCDSNVVLNLIINNSSTFAINDTVCENYFFNNQILTNSGIYYDTLLNSNSCDSLVELNLLIQQSLCYDSHNLVVFPNPTHSDLFFKNQYGELKKLFNSMGQLIYTTRENKINVSSYSKGVYYISCNNQVRKVIIE